MASTLSTAEYITDQMKDAGEISFKKMFGEYGLYCNGKIFGSICDDRLFIKPTDEGRNFIKDVVEAAPYPGAKNQFLIEDQVDNREWLCELVRITVAVLPEPKPKKKKVKK